jgi:hypothetical protein
MASLFAYVSFTNTAFAYPENVRKGYPSCASCHVSPTGGGVLTNYGRKSSGEFIATWGNEAESEFAWGAAPLPGWLALGADVRHLSYKRELNRQITERRLIMQQEGEIAVNIAGKAWLDFSRGKYSNFESSQRAYLLFNATENIYVRAGKYFAPFGILRADHTAISRRAVGMDQGRETINAELGYQDERGELILTGIMGNWQTGDESVDPIFRDQGLNLRVAAYHGGNSQLGASAMGIQGEYVDRQALGLYAMTGVGDNSWYLGEVILERRRLANTGSLFHEAIINHHQFGWEFFRGAHLIGNIETLSPIAGKLHSTEWSVGPGIQWFPRPHFEFTVQANRFMRKSSSDNQGSELKMVSHLWL